MTKKKLVLFLIFYLVAGINICFPENSAPKKEALFWQSLKSNKVQCRLCPRKCILSPGQKGFCRGRKNIGGKLYSLTYGKPVALHADPIEKKPLYHVYPGTKSFSLATAGCNLRCKFCQNWEISQLDAEMVDVSYRLPQAIIKAAKDKNCPTIAFTYTEPTIFYEYMIDIAKEASKQKIESVMHSAGQIREKPLRKLAKHLTAANIDLKAFSQDFYSSYTQGSLETVLNSLKILDQEGVWVEITNLLIPGANDSKEDLRKLCRWVVKNLGAETPIHFSRFYPMYKLTNLSPTPLSSLKRAEKIAKEEGLHFIYIGNVPEQIGENTYCPNCEKLLIKRVGYHVLDNKIEEGRCPYCGKKIPGIWNQ
ncbi:MAG: AmmeMemoRadiSam system radical SAM enzyme [Candidatus Omnitrophica bacterium]|nr:AmmeMemoRadiSam system radical SAM enzyme [Candidatus Omnitrophota bacterium]MCF7891811.1 AmmeMemoRadiSam system radical SAM enzyme [Candidatus Omnitrophota bacterium]MCF7897800.1 AmmeMemoRadiSam system radical SAM enzyme [Candidatus Omnitrophota bacterium]MCF7909174.1 AmmeMemoRadiSam system radical SAM enzyme [Candidatus Omnitrophota bacterium]